MELMMGDIARLSQDAVELAIDVNGSAPIERIDIFESLDLLERGLASRARSPVSGPSVEHAPVPRATPAISGATFSAPSARNGLKRPL